MPGSSILPFPKLPKHNQFYCHQDREIKGYRIFSYDKTTELLQAVGKTVTTRNFYRITRSIDGVALATLEQDRIDNKYHILGIHDQEIADYSITTDGISLTIGNSKYYSKPLQRGKLFDFKNKDDILVMTVDKKLISLKDIYHVVQSYDFPSLIAQLTPIVIDLVYHS